MRFRLLGKFDQVLCMQSQFEVWEYSYDIQSVAVSVWGFSQATVGDVSNAPVACSVCERYLS